MLVLQEVTSDSVHRLCYLLILFGNQRILFDSQVIIEGKQSVTCLHSKTPTLLIADLAHRLHLVLQLRP